MILYTRMGWLVPALWLGALALAGQVAPGLAAEHGRGLGTVAAVFLMAAAVSAPLVWLAGAVLNREKVPTAIRPLGREREVMWGTHTFYQLPLGYWAVMIPAATLVAWGIARVG